MRYLLVLLYCYWVDSGRRLFSILTTTTTGLPPTRSRFLPPPFSSGQDCSHSVAFSHSACCLPATTVLGFSTIPPWFHTTTYYHHLPLPGTFCVSGFTPTYSSAYYILCMAFPAHLLAYHLPTWVTHLPALLQLHTTTGQDSPAVLTCVPCRWELLLSTWVAFYTCLLFTPLSTCTCYYLPLLSAHLHTTRILLVRVRSAFYLPPLLQALRVRQDRTLPSLRVSTFSFARCRRKTTYTSFPVLYLRITRMLLPLRALRWVPRFHAYRHTLLRLRSFPAFCTAAHLPLDFRTASWILGSACRFLIVVLSRTTAVHLLCLPP